MNTLKNIFQYILNVLLTCLYAPSRIYSAKYNTTHGTKKLYDLLPFIFSRNDYYYLNFKFPVINNKYNVNVPCNVQKYFNKITKSFLQPHWKWLVNQKVWFVSLILLYKIPHVMTLSLLRIFIIYFVLWFF